MLLLTWIGWRFFIAPGPNEATVEPAPPAAPRPARRIALRVPPWLANPWLLLAILAGATATVGVLALSARINPDPLEATEMLRQAHIQMALNPERLVPPPPLPPSMFVGSERPALETADRDWNKLDPRFLQPLLLTLARLEERGYTFALLEGYRSPERQEVLAGMGSHVTNARAFQSKHQFGRAADIAPIRDGRLVISERDPWAMGAYQALGEEAEKAGLTWGGRWWFKDYGHLEAGGGLPAIGRKSQ